MTILKLGKRSVLNTNTDVPPGCKCLYFWVTKEALSEHCKLCIFSFKCSNLCRKYATLRKND